MLKLVLYTIFYTASRADDQEIKFGTALKYIPDEVKKHYNFIDPKIKWRPDHGLTDEHFKPPIKDVTRHKSHDDVNRVPDDKIHVEIIPDDEHIIISKHISDAEVQHILAIKSRMMEFETKVKSGAFKK